jgi:uncharacterized protein YdhG (YjbR/CyaY superfamily)
VATISGIKAHYRRTLAIYGIANPSIRQIQCSGKIVVAVEPEHWLVPKVFQDLMKGNEMRANQAAPQNIDEYIAGFPNDIQEVLQKIRMTIRQASPEAEETISYQMPTFTLKGNLVHFAAFKKHIGFYPTPTAIEKFKNELSLYEGAKGSVRFPMNEPIPFDLIGEIVKFRVKEKLQRAEIMEKKKQERVAMR